MSKVNELRNKSAIEWGRRGCLDGMDNVAADALFHAQRSELYQEMQTISKSLVSEVNERFSQTSDTGSFSSQDMVDNYLAERPLATLDNGMLHSSVEAIEQFWQHNRLAIEPYRCSLMNTPRLPLNCCSRTHSWFSNI